MKQGLSLGLSLGLSQQLALTPQLQQAIRLLQLSTLELGQEVEQMLDNNPFLELYTEAAPREEFGLAQADAPVRQDDWELEQAQERVADFGVTGMTPSSREHAASPAEGLDDAPGWDGDGSADVSPDDGEWGGDAAAHHPRTEDGPQDAMELARNAESLSDFLQQQTLALRLTDVDRAALYFLIASLNDDGYLEDSLEALADGLASGDKAQAQELLERFSVALHWLQNLAPTGVGARSLAECLQLQLRQLQAPGDKPPAYPADVLRTALTICRQPLDWLARRDIRRLVRVCRVPEAQVRAGIALIGRLEPKPGRRFVKVEHKTVVPDVIVHTLGHGSQAQFQARLNTDAMPRLQVNTLYANALRSHQGEGSLALQQRLQEARWFIKSIQQRFDTILRVARAIIARQKGFFVYGEMAMRPLVLRDIADELGLHESTISRVVNGKYMATPYGTLELRYFFGSALGMQAGGSTSSRAVRALIKQLIEAENPKQPLSDQRLAELLNAQGIACARRTVAKYREILRIAPTSLRKAMA